MGSTRKTKSASKTASTVVDRAAAKNEADAGPVRAVLRTLLPDGSRPTDVDVSRVPFWPPDAYAVAATLLERSGGYHFIQPRRFDPRGEPPPEAEDPFGIFGANQLALRIRGMAWAHGLPFLSKLSEHYLEYLSRSKAHFRRRYKFYDTETLAYAEQQIPLVTAAEIQSRWNELLESDEQVLHPSYGSPGTRIDAFPKWWKPALQLLIMADEASVGLGFPSPVEAKTFCQDLLEREESTTDLGERVSAWRKYTDDDPLLIRSLCWMVAPDMACVLPKARTPMVGCTLRSLSHHLALAPPAGRATVRWHLLPAGNRDSQSVFNMMLVPFPYTIDSRCFRPSDADGHYDLFETDQLWLSNNLSDLASMIERMIEASEAEIHGVVLPEYALNWAAFEVVRQALLRHPSIELFVCGLSQDKPGSDDKGGGLAKGNFVATCMRAPQGPPEETGIGKWDVITVRGKHHRWRLDGRQLTRYGLAHRLSPARGWWENIDLESRKIDVIPFRRGSAVTALICEDLARIEPCQAVLRATGPNLVIVLLMDGPQTEQRWPNQYAGVLADDPGCSVVTLTSLGLSRRARESGDRSPLSIGLWRDGFGVTRRLQLAEEEQALVITLMGESLEESTLDGRSDGGSAFGWRLSGVAPISVPVT